MTSFVDEKKFYRLFKFSCDTSSKVTRAFTESNILKDFDNSLQKFLEDKKHDIYHLWCHYTKCCKCSNFQPTNANALVKKQFTKLYDIGTNYPKGHYIQDKYKKVIQHCLCCISVNSQCSLEKLDLTILCTLLKNCFNLSPSENMWLERIRNIRNNLSHAESSTEFDKGRLDKWWAVLEGAVLGLASKVPPVYYEKSIKENIDLLKNFDLTENNIRDIIVQITANNEKFQDRLLHQQNNNFNRLLHEQQEQSDTLREVLTHRLQQHEDKIDIAIKNIRFNIMLKDVPSKTNLSSSPSTTSSDHQDSQLFSTRPSPDHETTQSSLTTTTSPDHQAFQPSSTATMSSYNQATQSALGATTSLDHEATQSSSKATTSYIHQATLSYPIAHMFSDHQHNQASIPSTTATTSIDQVTPSSQTETNSLESHTIRTSNMETDNMNLEGDRSSLEDSHIQCVEWRLANPPNTWKVEEMKTTLTQMSALLNQWFKVEFVYVGSLVINTSVPKHILMNREFLKSAIKSFLEKIVEVCNIDSSKPEKIQVDFTVKNRIPDAVLTTDSAWIKQEDICASTEKQYGVQCPHCHNCFCCKQCDEKQEKIQHLEKYNNELEIDLERFLISVQKTKSKFKMTDEKKDDRVLEPLRKKARLEADVEKSISGDLEQMAVDDDAECDVCKSIIEEEKNEMVFCDGCDVCVHQACYGVQNIPEGKWYCKPCLEHVKPKCVFCPNTGGAMKKTSEGTKWAHVRCAWWIPEVTIGNPKEMEPIINIDKIPDERWALQCYLCKEKVGACIQCVVKTCRKAFHVTCADINKLKMEEVESSPDTDLLLKAYCKVHSHPGSPKKKTQRKMKAARSQTSLQRKFADKAGVKEKQNRAVQSLDMISKDSTTEAKSEKGIEALHK